MLLCQLPIYLISMSEQWIKLGMKPLYSSCTYRRVCFITEKLGNTHSIAYICWIEKCKQQQGKGSYTIRNLDSTSVNQT